MKHPPILGLSQTSKIPFFNLFDHAGKLVQENKVTNCSVAGYKDDLATTESKWLKNVSSDNGVGYDINWSGVVPVQSGYVGSNAWFNIEL